MARKLVKKLTGKEEQPDDSPPGFELLHTLRGHKGIIWEIAFSPDGQTLASGSSDNTIRLWKAGSGELQRTLEGHGNAVVNVAWSPDGRTLASGSYDLTIHLWDVKSGELQRPLEGHKDTVYSVAWSPDGRTLASGSDKTIHLWDAESGKLQRTLEGHSSIVRNLAWSPDGQVIASGSEEMTIHLWDAASGNQLQTLAGHSKRVYCVAWSPDGRVLVSGSVDRTIRLWDADGKQQLSMLEGHTNTVVDVHFSPEGRLLASKSIDGTVRLWRADTGDLLVILNEPSSLAQLFGLAFHPTEPILATLGEEDTVIRIWRLDYDVLLGGEPVTESVRYTTAKIVLVGDSGVGKTGLGWRLAHDEFKEHSSTHGQQFWVIDELGTTRTDGTECEAVLWDLAGQPDYRLVHSLFLDDVDLALLLFDPTNRQEPLSGVDFWLNQLQQGDQTLCRCLLVGARSDMGTATLTDAELEAYCQKQGIHGGYIATSAKAGDGLPELMDKLKAQIPWDAMTATVTTATFKRIKEYVLSLKADEERAGVLVSPETLRGRLQAEDTDWEFTDAEMMTAVGHLKNLGYVAILRGSRGDVSILLTPDLLINLASSFILEARRNPRGLGFLVENRLLRGDYRFPELADLAEDERDILLDAATVLFLERNVCFRETFNQQILLVFPSLINEKRPADDLEPVEEVTYRVRGAVENVYASLVVLLGYTNTFARTNQWQNQAQYEFEEGGICGFLQTDNQGGEIELVLYYAPDTPAYVPPIFRGLFERFLIRHDLEITRYQPVTCSHCGERLARTVVMDQLERGRDFSFCNDCGKKLILPAREAVTALPPHQEKRLAVQQQIARRRTAFEAALARLKGILRDQEAKEKTPTCFISYAWGVPEHERWVLQLAKDMRNAEIDVLLDRWHNPPGGDIDRFTDQIIKSDFVAVVGTPLLKAKYESEDSDPVVASELA